MKALALFTIFVLISGTVTVSSISDVYAQNDLNILLRIATQADKQIINQLEKTFDDSIPFDIQSLYDKGHTSVLTLENSLPDNIEQARENFLIAMKSFKQITKMMSESTIEQKSTSSNVSDRDLQSELNRLNKYFQKLKTISEKHNTGIEFSEIEELFTQAHQQINSNEIESATNSIHQLESLIHTIKKNISESSSHSSSDRIKEFASKQLNKIQKILEDPLIDSNMPELERANSLVREIETLISEDNVSDVKKKFGELNKLVKIIKNSIR